VTLFSDISTLTCSWLAGRTSQHCWRIRKFSWPRGLLLSLSFVVGHHIKTRPDRFNSFGHASALPPSTAFAEVDRRHFRSSTQQSITLLILCRFVNMLVTWLVTSVSLICCDMWQFRSDGKYSVERIQTDFPRRAVKNIYSIYIHIYILVFVNDSPSWWRQSPTTRLSFALHRRLGFRNC